MTENSDPDPEELLQQSRQQRRTSTEPAPAAEESGDEQLSLEEAVTHAFADLEDGDLNSTFGFRDERLVALLVGLERSGQLTEVVTDAQETLGRDREPEAATRSQAASLLIRIGLETLDPDLLEAGRVGYSRHLQDKAEDF